MDLASEPKPFRECVALFELLRRLGFPPSSPRLTASQVSQNFTEIGVSVTFGGKKTTFRSGTVAGSVEAVQAKWKALLASIRTRAGAGAVATYYRASEVKENSTKILLSLKKEGFQVPPPMLN